MKRPHPFRLRDEDRAVLDVLAGRLLLDVPSTLHIVIVLGARELGIRQEEFLTAVARTQASPPPPVSPSPLQERAAKGGVARAAKLTPDERSNIATKAANARWNPGEGPPKA